MNELLLSDFLEQLAEGPIEKVVLFYEGSFYEVRERERRTTYEEILSYLGIPVIPKDKLNVILDWDEAREFLRYPTDYRHGTTSYYKFHGPIFFVVWALKKIIFPTYVSNGTQIVCISRNPDPDFFQVPLTANTSDGE